MHEWRKITYFDSKSFVLIINTSIECSKCTVNTYVMRKSTACGPCESPIHNINVYKKMIKKEIPIR